MKKKHQKKFCINSLKKDTIKSLTEIECFLNNLNYYCNFIRLFNFFKK